MTYGLVEEAQLDGLLTASTVSRAADFAAVNKHCAEVPDSFGPAIPGLVV